MFHFNIETILLQYEIKHAELFTAT